MDTDFTRDLECDFVEVLALATRDPENPFLGGAEQVMAEFSKSLTQAGHTVHYVCSRFPSSRREAWVNGLHVIRLAPEGTLAPLAMIEYRRKFRGKIGLVLEQISGGAAIPFCAPLYVSEPVASVWFQDHVPIFREEYPALALPALMALERFLVSIHKDSQVLAISMASKLSLVKKGGDPSRIRVFYPGLSERFLGLGTPLGAGARGPRIVCLSKIRRYKCIHHAILALSEIVKQIPEAKLSIIGRPGDVSYLSELVNLVKKLYLENNVEFEIGVSENRKMELLQSGRALVSPAPVEGFGIAVIEANACGMPAVGSDGIPDEALKEGTNGFRVPFGDVKAIAQRVTWLLSDDELFNRLSISSYHFSQQFTWNRASQPLLELIDLLDVHDTEDKDGQ